MIITHAMFIQRELFPGFEVGDFSPVKLMGVVNLSPESFYKGSFIPTDQLKNKIESFLQNGASIIDLGARSTAPGVEAITIEEEKARILKTLEQIFMFLPKSTIISLDTQYAAVANAAWDLVRAHQFPFIINDVSSFRTDPKLMEFVAREKIPAIIMASKNRPGDTRTVDEILFALYSTITALQKLNYPLEKLIIDPGVGKWTPDKTYEYDLAIIDQLEAFRCFGCPILVGLSRKSFLGSVLNEKNPQNREMGSLAATSIAVYNGAHIIRTHDVNKEMVQTVQTASAIRRKPLEIQNNKQSAQLIGTLNCVESGYYLLRQFGVTPAGSRIMKNKMVTKIIVLKNVTAPQGLILKQELLARGGDVALHGQVITTEWKKYDECFDIVLIGTVKQLQNLVQKLKGQQLKLDLLARLIEDIMQKDQEVTTLYSKDYPQILK